MKRNWLKTRAPLGCILAWLSLCTPLEASPVPDDFPRFIVPGHEKEMTSLRALYWLHYEPGGPLIPLWDEWMTMSTLWPARGTNGAPGAMRERWASALGRRGLNSEGYVLTQQHDGLAHAEGWPFPLWTQAGGIGWHFRGTGIPGYDAPPAKPDGWKVSSGKGGEINAKGWQIELAEPGATAQAPAFSISAKAAPWLRLNWWASGLAGARCYVEWTTAAEPEFSAKRRACFDPSQASETQGETRTMVAMWRLPGWGGTITGLRLGFDNRGPAKVVIKSFHTACDSRQVINNPNFIRGACEYFLWTHDVTFLREQAGRLRKAMRYQMSEFDTQKRKCVYVTWPGHEGRSGVRRTADGRKEVLPGEGIGGNYWDLLPFGGEDALATIYYYDSLLDLAKLEEATAAHPEWNVARGADAFDPAELRRHAAEVRQYGQRRFWNEKTGRFGTVDLEGQMHDYGFTFLNNEAVYYGFASAKQAKSIRDWISGRRIVAGDTSTGADIYHWRFGPRSTTLRNVDYYFWAWSNPESIPFGFQVQDGGAVLGFSYHDLMARLAVEGADAAWERLREITRWFDETQVAGGYREYYKDGTRGSLQGGNVPGGLGLDREFFESILVPQVMLYGFLGFQPTVDGFSVKPNLPKSWPELTVTRIHVHDAVIEVTAKGRTVTVRETVPGREKLLVDLAPGWNLNSERGRVTARQATGH